MTKWTIEQYNGTIWTGISGIELDHVTEELNGHEEAMFSLPNTATNRTLLGTNSTVRIQYDENTVFTGVLYGADYQLKKVTAIVYNDVIERFRRGVITGTISFPDDATDILNTVNDYSSGTIAVGTCPTTPNVTLNLDYTTCLDATKALAESLNMDWWGDTVQNAVGYIHIGTKGATESAGTVTQSSIISSRVIDRAKNRDKVYVIGTDEEGNRLIGTAGEGSDAAVFTHNEAADQTTIDNIAAQKLTELNQDNCGISLEVLSSVSYNLHSGDILTVQTTQFDLDDDFRIEKIEKGPVKTTIELDRKKSVVDEALSLLANLSNSPTLLPTYNGAGPSYIVYKVGSKTYARANRDGLTSYSGTSTATVLRQAADAMGSGEIFVLDGDYNLDTTMAGTFNGIEADIAVLFGSEASLIGEGNGTNFNIAADMDYAFATKPDQVNWRNYFGHFNIDGQKASRSKGAGIRLHNVQHGCVENCGFYNMKDDALYLDGEGLESGRGCLGNHIQNNNIEGFEAHGIHCENDSYDHFISHNIIGGSLETCGTAIECIFTTQAVINNNHIWQTDVGIHFYRTGQAKITNNIVYHTEGVGIFVQNSDDVLIEDNKVEDCCQTKDLDGILIEGTTIGTAPPVQYYSDNATIVGNRVFSTYQDDDRYMRGIRIGNYARYGLIVANNCIGNADQTYDIYATGTATDDTIIAANQGRYVGEFDIKGALKMNGTTIITDGLVLQNVTADASIITSGAFGTARIPTTHTEHANGITVGGVQVVGSQQNTMSAPANLGNDSWPAALGDDSPPTDLGNDSPPQDISVTGTAADGTARTKINEVIDFIETDYDLLKAKVNALITSNGTNYDAIQSKLNELIGNVDDALDALKTHGLIASS